MLIWYLARAAGLSAYLCLSVATGVGAMSARRRDDLEARVVWQYVHRAAAVCALALLGLHVVTLLADSYAHVGVAGLLPLRSGYRPFAVTLGVLALYLVVAVVLSGVLRSRLAAFGPTTRTWRALHLASYAAWALSGVHFLLAGTDAHQPWALAVLLAGVGVVLAGVSARLSDRGRVRSRPAAPAVPVGQRVAAVPVGQRIAAVPVGQRIAARSVPIAAKSPIDARR